MTRSIRILVLVAAATLLPYAAARAQTALTAEDMAEIHNLYAHYNLMLDGADAEAWADTFVEDGRFGTSEGREALVAFAVGFAEANPNTRHWNTNIRITATPEGAAGTCYLMLWNVGVRPQQIVLTGTYQDELVRTSDGWRFKSRQVQVDRPAAE